jgi:hypothetical protein
LAQENIENSRLTREGLMTREGAIERMALEQTTEPAIIESFPCETGLSRDEVYCRAE